MGWADNHIENLKKEGTVSFRPKGNSMVPKINSGDLVTVVEAGDLAVGDIVLCKVQGRQYVFSLQEWHKIQARRGHVHSYLILDKKPEPFIWCGGWPTAVEIASANPEQLMVGRCHPEDSDFIFYVLSREVHAKLLE